MNLLKTALNTIAFMAIISAVSAITNTIITEITDIVNAYENGITKIKDLSSEIKSLESEQSSLNDELKTSQERLLELQKLEMPTLFQKDEIENLKEYNQQLETQIRLKELEIEQKKQEANTEAQKLYKNSQIDNNVLDDGFTEDYNGWDYAFSIITGGMYASVKNGIQNAANFFQGNTWEQQMGYLEAAEKTLKNYNETLELEEDLVNANQNLIVKNVDSIKAKISETGYLTDQGIYDVFGNDIDAEKAFGLTMEEFKSLLNDTVVAFDPAAYIDEYYQNRINMINSAIDTSRNSLDGYISGLQTRLSEWETEKLGLDPDKSENAERIKELDAAIERAESVIDNLNRKKIFTEVYNDAKFSSVTVQLEDLAKQGKLTNDTFNKVDGIEEFKEALAAVGENDISYIIYSIIDKVQESDHAFDSAAESAKNYASSISEIKEKTDEFLKNSDLFKSAVEKQKNSESLSYDEVMGLAELDPSIAQNVQKTADGYSIAIDKLTEANNKYKETSVGGIQDGINETKQDISGAEAEINELVREKQEIYAELNLNKNNDHYDRNEANNRIYEIENQIEELTNAVNNGKDIIAAYNLVLEELNSIASVSLDELFTGYEALNTVTEEFNNNGKISYDTLQKITQVYPSLKSAVDDYLLGVINENELIAQLSERYREDGDNYYQCLLAKAGYEEDYINAVFGGSDDIVNYFAKNYGIDLQNYEGYLQQKQAIQEKYDNAVYGGLSKYFDENGKETEDFLSLSDHTKWEIQSIYEEYLNAIEDLGGIYEVEGSAFEIDFGKIKDSTNNALNSMLNSSGISSSGSSDFSKTFDWIETAVEKASKAVSKLGNIVSSTFKSWTTRNGALKDEIGEATKEISLQEKAYNQYMKKANSVGLSDYWADRVRNGAVDISEITDGNLSDKIDEYKDWYEKAQDCKDAVDELNASLAELYEDKFSNISKEFEGRLNEIQHLSNEYDIGIDTLEAKGYLSSVKYYSALKETQLQSLNLLKEELSELQTAFSDAVKNGGIDEYSEEWFTLKSSINDVSEEILKANQTLAEYAKTMREIEWEHFDYLQERISDITAEADFLIDLIGNGDMFDGKGNYTADGLSVLGLYAQNYNVYMAQADKYAKELAEIEREIANDQYNTDLIERRQELLKLQQDAIKAAEDEKQAMLDLAKDGIQEQIDALKELVDAYEEALDSAKDLHDYQKQIADHTSEISNLEKQLEAYKNDNSEETKVTVQKLEEQLKQAKEDLQETEYERYISEQKKLLDELYTEYEDYMNQRMDDVDALLEDLINTVNENSGAISDNLTKTAEDAGYDLSVYMQDIWNNATDTITNTVALYGNEFTDTLTLVYQVLNSIEANTAALISAADGESQNYVSGANKDNSAGNTVVKQPPSNAGGGNNGGSSGGGSSANKGDASEIKAGDKINASGALIYDYAGDTTGEKQYFAGDPIYTVLSELNGYLKVRWHKLDSGVTGWFKKSDVKAYKNGGLVDYTGIAQLDGTPSNPEYVLNSNDTKNFLALNGALKNVDAKKLLGINAVMPKIEDFVNTNGDMPNTRAMRNADFSTNMGDINITIPIERVEDYNDFVNQLRSDRKFERFVQSVTVDRLAGKSSLAKNNLKW